jgi:hypothetical protein
MKRLFKEDVASFVRELKGSYKVAAPQERDGEYAFDFVEDEDKVVLDYPSTILPIKKFFFPPEEIILEYDLSAEEEIKFKSEPKADEICILGAHPCDINALLRFDMVYLDDKFDPFYKKRREHALIIGVYCTHPSEACFCGSMGTDRVEDGYDLMLIDGGDEYGVEIGSEKGDRIVNSMEIFKDRKDMERPKLEGFIREVETKDLPELMLEKYESDLWNDFGEKCLGCGKCVLVCPTCFCYNVVDDIGLDGKNGERKRIWDGCVLTDFTLVAGGLNFRNDRTSRLKQRILHKFSYFDDKYGVSGCTGCGRCINVCPADIDCTRIVGLLRSESK